MMRNALRARRDLKCTDCLNHATQLIHQCTSRGNDRRICESVVQRPFFRASHPPSGIFRTYEKCYAGAYSPCMQGMHCMPNHLPKKENNNLNKYSSVARGGAGGARAPPIGL